MALVLPAHDEVESVSAVVRRAPRKVAGRPVLVIVVDDGSTDGTADAATDAGALVVRHAARRGLGAAVRTGLATAVAQGAAVIAFCDADGEYAPEELAAMTAPILTGDADYVVGSRFAGRIERMLWRRRLGNRVLTWLLRRVSRVPLTDGQSGYRALSRQAASAATIEHDFNYAQVLTLDLVAQGFRYEEVPISYRFREHGRSFIRLVPYLCAVLPAMWRVVHRAPSGAERNAITRRRIAIALAAIAVGCAALTGLKTWPDTRAALGDADPLLLALAVLLAVLGMVALASPWRSVARTFGAPELSPNRWLRAYFTGEIGKYVPGGIWPVVGRAEQARRAGVPATTAYVSVPFSLGYAYLAAGVVLALAAVPAVAAGGDVGPVAWALLIVPVGLVTIHPAVLGRAVRAAERLSRRSLAINVPPWSRSLGLVARYVPAWLIIGCATVAVARALTPEADPVAIFAAAVASWLVGFLFLPAPGGVGVREMTFATVAPMSFGLAFAIAATARLVFVVVDLVLFTVAARTRAPKPSILDDVIAEPVAGRVPPSPIEIAAGS